jgi:ribosomal protein L40E
MFPDTCRFCEHVNPPDAKFCNACGGALHLVPCSRCGAVNDVTATTCYQCRDPLSGRGKSTPEIPQPAAEPPKSAPRSHAHAIVGTAIFAVVVVAGYFSYRQAWILGEAQSLVTSSRVDNRGGFDSAGAVPGNAIAGDMTPSKRDDNTRSVNTAAAQSKIPLAGAAPAASQPPEHRQPVESIAARVATVPVARVKSINEGRVAERAPLRLKACTKAAAALGLCTLKPAQEMETASAATVKPVIARSKANDVGKAGQREAQRQDACPDGVAALGLCAQRTKQEGK